MFIRLFYLSFFLFFIFSPNHLKGQNYKGLIENGIIMSIHAFNKDIQSINSLATENGISLDYVDSKLIANTELVNEVSLESIHIRMGVEIGEAVFSCNSLQDVIRVISFLDSNEVFFNPVESEKFENLGIPLKMERAFVLQFVQNETLELYAVCLIEVDFDTGKIFFHTLKIEDGYKLANITKLIFDEYLRQ